MFPREPLHPFVLPIIQILCTHPPVISILIRFPKRGQPNLSSQAIIFLIDIYLSPILSYAQLFLLRHLAHPPIVTLVTDGGSWSQKEGTGDHGADEG